MKTSIIEVRDMLSVLSVVGVEKRIGDVPGVESVTVNHAAGNATVRYDETRLKIADIKSDVRQSGYESASPAPASPASVGDGHEGHSKSGASPAPPSPAAPKSASNAGDGSPANAAPSDEKKDKAAPDAMAKPSPAAASVSAAPKSGPDGAAGAPASASPAVNGKTGKAAPDKS